MIQATWAYYIQPNENSLLTTSIHNHVFCIQLWGYIHLWFVVVESCIIYLHHITKATVTVTFFPQVLQACQTISTTTASSFPGTTPPHCMQAMFGIFTYKETYSSLKMCKIWAKNLKQTVAFGLWWILSNFSVPNLQSRQIHHKLCTISRLYIIPSPFLHQLLYHTPVDAGPMCIFNYLLTRTVFCTHLYIVLFLHVIHCQLMLLMHLLYQHLKHCIPVLKFCKQGTSLHWHMLLLYPLLLCMNSL